MKIKTSDLSGIALDWAVAKCDGIMVNVHYGFRGSYIVYNSDVYKPSSNWSQGGPIIERERIELQPIYQHEWEAWIFDKAFIEGDTPLIAAMRTHVASKLGEEIEVPDELIGE